MPKSSMHDVRDSRRGFIRVAPKARFSVAWRDVSYDGLDLSVYGLSFLVPARAPEVAAMGLEALLEGLRFAVDGREIEVGARVKHLQSVRDKRLGQCVRVGIEFETIRPEDIWFLSSYTVKLGVPKPTRLKVNLGKYLGGKEKTKRKTRTKAKLKPKAKAKAKTRANKKAGRDRKARGRR